MNSRHRDLLQAAIRIHQSYVDQRVAVDEAALPQAEWDECQRLARHLAGARRRKWPNAERHVRLCLGRAVRQLQSTLEAAQQSLAEPRLASVPSLRQLYEELLALDDEFADVNVDLRGKTVTVNTEPIKLEGIHLGDFGIELNWRKLGQSGPYFIRSLDPHSAASNSEVDHPHVDGGRLCEGEGQAAIRGALIEGRLVDFFIIVRQILGTYNSSSAYVSLDSWHALNCDDCGGSVDEDEQYRCDGCESDICVGCAADCCTCEACVCNSCSSRCHGCRQWHCRDCLRECAVCGESFCKECLSHEECCECRNDEVADESSSDASAEVHADRVGEVAVPT